MNNTVLANSCNSPYNSSQKNIIITIAIIKRLEDFMMDHFVNETLVTIVMNFQSQILPSFYGM